MTTAELRCQLIERAKRLIQDGKEVTDDVTLTLRFDGDYEPEKRLVTDVAVADGKLVLTLMPCDEGGAFGDAEEMDEDELVRMIDTDEIEALVESLQ